MVFGLRMRVVYLVNLSDREASGVQAYFSVHDILCDNGRVLYLLRPLLLPLEKPYRRAYLHHARARNGVRALRAFLNQGLQNGAGVYPDLFV